MTGNNNKKEIAVIAGMAAGFGVALARELLQAGYAVLGLSRTAAKENDLAQQVSDLGGNYRHYACDLSDPDQVAQTFKDIARAQGQPNVLIYNAMQLNPKPFMKLTPAEFEKSWLSTCFGAMVAAQAALPGMLARGGGAIIFTGATASVKGNPSFAAFASSKFALRGLAQSLAREFAPQGVHVVNTLIDGVIWGPQTQQRFTIARENCLEPEAIAKTYLQFIGQPPCAWTHELDLRPSSEKF